MKCMLSSPQSQSLLHHLDRLKAYTILILDTKENVPFPVMMMNGLRDIPILVFFTHLKMANKGQCENYLFADLQGQK